MTPRPPSSRANKELWHLPDENAGRRLDNVLVTKLRLPRSALYRLIRLGAVRVNGKKAKPDYRLVAGDELLLPALEKTSEQPPPPLPAADAIAATRNSLLGRGNGFLVLNKPSGLSVQGGTGIRIHQRDLALAAFPSEPRIELVHRLDKGTSGCLVLATQLAFAQHFQRQMKAHQVQKNYLCLVCGRWPREHRQIEGLLLSSKAVPKLHRSAEHRRAETGVSVLQYLPEHTLVRAQPLTGRTHQLRIQFAQAGAPIAGDDRYGDRLHNRQLAKTGLKRIFLHAHTVQFTEVGGQSHKFTAPLGDELLGWLTKTAKTG